MTNFKVVNPGGHCLLQVPNNYETDLIYPIIEKASELAKVSYSVADDSTKMKLKVCCGWMSL